MKKKGKGFTTKHRGSNNPKPKPKPKPTPNPNPNPKVLQQSIEAQINYKPLAGLLN